jgi:hypothetical protein
MRRILLTLATAGSLTAIASTVPLVHTDQAAMVNQLTVGTRVEVNSTQGGQGLIAAAETSASSKNTLGSAEDESTLSIYGALFTAFILMATIAFKRTRNRKP